MGEAKAPQHLKKEAFEDSGVMLKWGCSMRCLV
jgi:hypothetical protein